MVEQYVRTFFPDPTRAAVLVADDQENNRKTLEFALQQQGFSNILLASNGHEALELYKTHADDIVLVVTDYRMPEMMGDELFRRLMEIDEGIRVVMCSGMPDEKTDALLKNGLRGFVQKPFTSEEFGLALVEALL